LRQTSWTWNKEVVKHNHSRWLAVMQVSSLWWHDATAHMHPSSLLWKLRVPQLVDKFPTFYGTKSFMTMLTRPHHQSLCKARLTQSIPFYPISLRSISILSFHLSLGLPSSPCPSKFSNQNPVYMSLLPDLCHKPCSSPPTYFHVNNISWDPNCKVFTNVLQPPVTTPISPSAR
jgi:hypothetical protein